MTGAVRAVAGGIGSPGICITARVWRHNFECVYDLEVRRKREMLLSFFGALLSLLCSEFCA